MTRRTIILSAVLAGSTALGSTFPALAASEDFPFASSPIAANAPMPNPFAGLEALGASDTPAAGSDIQLDYKGSIPLGGGSIVPAQFQRRPGDENRPDPQPPQPATRDFDPFAVAPPSPDAFPGDFIAIPDRWRVIESLNVNENLANPYRQNTLKGDRPIIGNDWFLVLAGISDTVVEPRSVPTPVDIFSGDPGSDDVFGEAQQLLLNENLILTASLIKGDTGFKPQDLEFRLTPIFNFNYTEAEEVGFLFNDNRDGQTRTETQLTIAEAFFDYHIRNVSERYDFDSVRVGVQPFNADFRGFLFQDNAIGARLFGTRQNNIYQYNLAFFQRLEKDVNSGLADIAEPPRNDFTFVANLYRQDFPVLGLVSQAIIAHNRNRDDSEIDANGFPARPAELGFTELREYDVTYPGINVDGRVGRVNLTGTLYGAFGDTSNSILTGEDSDIRAFFAAVEPSIDLDYVRLRLSALYASGDNDPFDGKDTGFDAIFENPLFAGADTSYFIRQQIPFIGGGFVGLNTRNGILPNLRHSREIGQSNFVNPGITLLGGGADFDVTPSFRVSFNANYLRFNETAPLEELRQQADIDREIGWDLSVATIYRPFINQQIVFRLSGAVLVPGRGFEDLFATEDGDLFYSGLANIILAY